MIGDIVDFQLHLVDKSGVTLAVGKSCPGRLATILVVAEVREADAREPSVCYPEAILNESTGLIGICVS